MREKRKSDIAIPDPTILFETFRERLDNKK